MYGETENGMRRMKIRISGIPGLAIDKYNTKKDILHTFVKKISKGSHGGFFSSVSYLLFGFNVLKYWERDNPALEVWI